MVRGQVVWYTMHGSEYEPKRGYASEFFTMYLSAYTDCWCSLSLKDLYISWDQASEGLILSGHLAVGITVGSIMFSVNGCIFKRDCAVLSHPKGLGIVASWRNRWVLLYQKFGLMLSHPGKFVCYYCTQNLVWYYRILKELFVIVHPEKDFVLFCLFILFVLNLQRREGFSVDTFDWCCCWTWVTHRLRAFFLRALAHLVSPARNRHPDHPTRWTTTFKTSSWGWTS